MEGTLVYLLVQYKSGDKEAFVEICEKMTPLIVKYARILKFDEMEDMKSELVLAMLECVERIEIYTNEREVLRYIKQAVEFRFHELYRRSKKQMNEVNLDNEDTEFVDIIFRYDPDDFRDIIYRQDMNSYIISLPESKREIARGILLEGSSDAEIGDKMHVTRQYVHRVRKEIYGRLRKNYT